MFQDNLFQNGKVEFPIVKDTTPNMTNPRLYGTTKDKALGAKNLLQHRVLFSVSSNKYIFADLKQRKSQ